MQNNQNQPNGYYTQNSEFNPNQPRVNYPQQNPTGYPPPQQFNGQYAHNGYPPPPQYNYPPQPKPVPILLQPNGIPVSPLLEEKKHIKSQYNRVGIALILNTALIYIMFFILQIILESFLDEDTLIIILNTVCMSVANIIAAAVCFKNMKTELAPMFNVQNVSGKLIFTSVFSALGLQTLSILISGVLAEFTDKFGIDIMGSAHDENYTGAALIISTIYTCILAPFTEEILFRGAVLKGLSKFNKGFAIIASALLFGLFHGNIPQFILATILGVLLAFITIKSNSIIPAIITHMAVNTTATIVDFIEEIIGADGEIFIIWSILMLIVGGIIILISTIKHKSELPKSTVPKAKRGFPLFISSVAVIIYIVIQMYEIIDSIEFI